MKIWLDPDHKYWAGEQLGKCWRVPGYTEIVKDLGIVQPNPFYTEQGREEGIALHKWLQFLASGKKSTAKPDPRIAGRVVGIEKFIRDTGFSIVGGETPQYDEVHRFATTPDLWGYIGNWTWVIDAKRGGKLPSHRLQTAAQQLALSHNGFRAQKRGSLYLTDEGYRLEEHDSGVDRIAWVDFVQAYHIKQEYKS